MTSPQANTFLGIPAEIRRKIYHDAGLVRGRCVPITSRKYMPPEERRWPFSSTPGSTYSLLQVSKDVNQEVSILICAHNTLALVQEDIDYGLAFLRRLGPLQCAALKSLSISLYHKKREPWRKAPVDSCCEPVTEARLALWLSAAHNVLSNTYQTLALQLFCHTGPKDITSTILQPFLEYPGHLKDLELELDCEQGASHHELMTLARRTACHAKGVEASPSFPFFALPVEIRHHILTYTDLVTPFSEIYWNAKRGFKILGIVPDCYPSCCDAEVFHDSYHQACRFFSCIGNDSAATGFRCCESTQNGRYGRCSITGHVCCRYRSGYSSRCRCWTNPKSLLVANRQLYHSAIRVLYSYNRVIIVPSGDFRTAISPIKERLDASVFITRHIWPEVLNYLRELEFVFPSINPSSTDLAQNPYSIDLCFALDHLASHACTKKLHVTVYLTTAGSVRKDDTGWFHRQLRKHNAATALRAHSHLLSAFRSMNGIKEFFVGLEWGWRPYGERLYYREDPEEAYSVLLNDEIDMLELSLERMIMGNGYTPGLERKLGRKPSVWLPLVLYRLEYTNWSEQLRHPDTGYI
ncbi:hypothetical protein F5Y07DRAFT_349409 [Xylaria sp. FL0933]|nr:hypothetical protein F5Y07DRAFT_349409 [Xylaria sp. FL0933]